MQTGLISFYWDWQPTLERLCRHLIDIVLNDQYELQYTLQLLQQLSLLVLMNTCLG